MLGVDGAIAGPSAIIVPFDGFVALTDTARIQALYAALVRHVGDGIWSDNSLTATLPGRTFAEAARIELNRVWKMEPAEESPVDETLLDLIALDASRAYAGALTHGILMAPGAVAWIERQALRSVRMVARADSSREHTQAILEMSGLGALFSFVRCSDDAPRAAELPSAQGSWRAIDRRLSAASIPVTRRKSIELVPHGAAAAAPFVASVHADTFSA